ncbi:hypothetical protein EJ04DRAFT_294645 [Polyplosphaeria fusca]|uniref:Uncharacterized protein n=1 Tax=Polyplosphaeria fusca TaxID=682080 RepID=A0A9P4RAC7_9PLEO|nr:hypothetical protein EJ04DRAFT_294645 [Polyplosphaeria fusca]
MCTNISARYDSRAGEGTMVYVIDSGIKARPPGVRRQHTRGAGFRKNRRRRYRSIRTWNGGCKSRKRKDARCGQESQSHVNQGVR